VALNFRVYSESLRDVHSYLAFEWKMRKAETLDLQVTVEEVFETIELIICEVRMKCYADNSLSCLTCFVAFAIGKPPQQPDAFNCGVYTIEYVKHVLILCSRDSPVRVSEFIRSNTFTIDDINKRRLKMAKKIRR
jgi:hypothetical protein